MNDMYQKVVNVLTERFDIQTSQFREEVSVVVRPAHIVDICRLLRDELGFEMLEDETAVDYWPEESPRFHIIYQIYSYQHNTRICLRVPLNGNAPSLPTIETIYPNANWHEREIWDFFGIHFEGHSDLRRILMPHDWEGYPMRKDYPLGYEEVMFSFNFDEIDGRKPYARD
ncbi:MAG: NADH-quinone oxidoreductase subunit C [Anaerolineales bacterium]|nr:NADH-quinone oxidoreductase subunit C [Anaerolineales bacterium]